MHRLPNARARAYRHPVKSTPSLAAALVVAGALVGCSSNPGPAGPEAAGSADAVATQSSSAAPADVPSAAPAASSAAAEPTSPPKPAEPEGPKEAIKDANAVVLELSVEASKGSITPAEADKLKAALVAKVAESSKIAMPTSQGVTAGRHVTTRLIVDVPTESKDGLTQKVQLNGVTSDGKCPLFDLNAKATLSDAHKDKPADVEEVRAAAIAQVLKKLEAEAPTMKPAASCSSEKKKPEAAPKKK